MKAASIKGRCVKINVGGSTMDVPRLPRFRDVGWRWAAYAASMAVVLFAILISRAEIELRRDVPCEVVSPSQLSVSAGAATISAVYVRPGQAVAAGDVLFRRVPTARLHGETSGSVAASHAEDEPVLAPQAGVVTWVDTTAGAPSTAPENVMVMLETKPAGPLLVALTIPSQWRAQTREGQVAWIRLDALPSLRFGALQARVDSVAMTTVVAANTALDRVGADAWERRAEGYLAWAWLPQRTVWREGKDWPILPGMRGTASIVIDRQTVGQWLLASLSRTTRG
jgi:hypothetical protein